jgi:hypothetical protein
MLENEEYFFQMTDGIRTMNRWLHVDMALHKDATYKRDTLDDK